MKERGLWVIVPSPEVVAEWDKASRMPTDFRGSSCPKDFDWFYGIVKQMRGGEVMHARGFTVSGSFRSPRG
jgi:hypothetical protein